MTFLISVTPSGDARLVLPRGVPWPRQFLGKVDGDLTHCALIATLTIVSLQQFPAAPDRPGAYAHGELFQRVILLLPSIRSERSGISHPCSCSCNGWCRRSDAAELEQGSPHPATASRQQQRW